MSNWKEPIKEQEEEDNIVNQEEDSTISIYDLFDESFYSSKSNQDTILEEIEKLVPKKVYINGITKFPAKFNVNIKLLHFINARGPVDFVDTYTSSEINSFQGNAIMERKLAVMIGIITKSDIKSIPANTERALYLALPVEVIPEIKKLFDEGWELTRPISEQINIFGEAPKSGTSKKTIYKCVVIPKKFDARGIPTPTEDVKTVIKKRIELEEQWMNKAK